MDNPQTATKLLGQQLERLSHLYDLLAQEQQILANRKLDELAEIPPKKTKLLLALQRGDHELARFDLKGVEFQEPLTRAKSQLQLCKRINEENGRMIALAMTSIGRIQGMMAKAGQQVATTTYTALGGTNSLSTTGNVISV